MAKRSVPDAPIESLRGGAYAFVDVETTGTSATYGGIIEIGILRVEDGVVVDTFSTLVNPGKTLPPIITSITGITDTQLDGAPPFEAVSGRVAELLDGATFVAHNAAFDYSFVKREFARLGTRWNAKSLCTVKVSRALYPEHARHNLDALIERHGLPMENRHRAFADAAAMAAFLRAAEGDRGADAVRVAVNRALGAPALPAGLDPAVIAGLPHAPGVYVFYGPEDEVLYVGKSVDIKARVRSHFTDSRRTGRERALCEATAFVDCEETSGELSALLLEAQRIKELAPIYNRRLRKAKRLATTREALDERGYRTAVAAYEDELDERRIDGVLGVSKSLSQGKAALKALARDHALCAKLLGLEAGAGPCFAHQLGRCGGACAGKEDPAAYNARFEAAFAKRRMKSWPFKGPMMLPEDPEAEEGTVYVMDQWRILKVLSYTADGYDEEDVDAEFDYDSYKILSKHLLRRDVRSKLVPYQASLRREVG